MELLLATKLSHPASNASGVAVDVANRFEGDLRVLHAPYPLPFQVEEIGVVNRMQRGARDARRRAMRLRVDDLSSDRETTTVVKPAKRPAEAILDEMEDQCPALVVLGTQQRRGLARFTAAPSVAEQVFDRAERPVLVVPDGGDKRLQKGVKVLVAVDLAEGYRRVLDTAAAWARAYRGELIAHHAYGLLTGLAGVPRPSYLMMRQAELAERELDDACARVEGAGLTVQRWSEPALSAGRAVLRRAEEAGAGLIVVGARRRGKLMRRWLGTPTTTVLRGADVPVLGVPLPSFG